mgnify:FL=1
MMEDSKRLRMTYRNFYPSQLGAVNGQAVQSVLCMQGYRTSLVDAVEVPYGPSKRNVLLNCKILFPKEYPRIRPTVSIQNPNCTVPLTQKMCTNAISCICLMVLPNTCRTQWTRNGTYSLRCLSSSNGLSRPIWYRE